MFLLWTMLAGCTITIPTGGDQPAEEAGEEAGPPEAGQKMAAKPGGFFRNVWTGADLPAPPIGRGQCNSMDDGGEVRGPACITDYIECGQSVIGHTRGGVDIFTTDFWNTNYCWPATYNHNSGDERVYQLDIPDGRTLGLPDERAKATVVLDSPCADLDLMAFPWSHGGCPTSGSSVSRCECLRKPGKQREVIELVAEYPQTWLIVVEGVDDHEGAFGLSVVCGAWYGAAQ